MKKDPTKIGYPDFYMSPHSPVSATATVTAAKVEIGPGERITLFEIVTGGRNLRTMCNTDDPESVVFYIILDGEIFKHLYVDEWGYDIMFMLTAGKPRPDFMIDCANIDKGYYTFSIFMPFEWKSSFKLEAYNYDKTAPHYCFAAVNYLILPPPE